mmetsp:Transcript_7822/g.24149  ORF Transcript_7822/g.24149 Transcript_7822/m.24149 type:complete len:536 (-) Transcript_7822:3722-5329(-)
MQDHLEGGPVGGVVCPAVLHQLGVARWCTALVGQGGALATQHRLLDGVHELVVVEGLLEGPQLPEHDAVGVDVGGEVVALLGEHLGGGPHRIVDHTALHRAAEHGFATEAKVGDLGHHLAVLVALEQHVGALEVAMDQVDAVQEAHAVGDVARQLEALRPGRREPCVGLLVQKLEQVGHVHELEHHHHGLEAYAQQRHHVRMLEAAHERHLAAELAKHLRVRGALVGVQLELVGACVAVQQLERDAIATPRTAVHVREAALTQQLAHLELLVGDHLALQLGERDVGRQLRDQHRGDALTHDDGAALGHRLLALLQREGERVAAVLVQAVRAGDGDAHVHAEAVADQRAHVLQQLDEALRGLRRGGGPARRDVQVLLVLHVQTHRAGALHQHHGALRVADRLPVQRVEEAHDDAREHAQRQEGEAQLPGELAVGRVRRQELGPDLGDGTVAVAVAQHRRHEEALRLVAALPLHRVHDLEALQQRAEERMYVDRIERRTPQRLEVTVGEEAAPHKALLHGDDGGEHVRQPLRVQDQQ